MLATRIAEDEIAVRLAHFDGCASWQPPEGVLEAATSSSAGEAGGEHDVPLERSRRDREVPGDPAVIRIEVRDGIAEKLPRLPGERRIALEDERHYVRGLESLCDENQLLPPSVRVRLTAQPRWRSIARWVHDHRAR